MIYIFDDFDKVTDEVYEFLFNLLPSTIKEKAQKRSGINRKITIVEYFLLKKILKFSGFPDFKYTSNGKPMLDGYHFSISHSGEVICVATGDCSIGVDIEKIFPYDEDIANLILNSNEIKMLDSKDKSLALTKLFVQKESAIKCLGKTLGNIKEILDEPDLSYKFEMYGNYIICVCHKKS